MAYLKKVAVPSENGTVEKIAMGKLEKRIMVEIVNGQVSVWKIADKLARSNYYRDVIYQTVINMKKKGLIEINNNGPKNGLTISLTNKGQNVLNQLVESSFTRFFYKFVDNCGNKFMC